MNFGFAFNANSRAKLHDLAERHRGHSNVPRTPTARLKSRIAAGSTSMPPMQR